jgi:hypothetical protein
MNSGGAGARPSGGGATGGSTGGGMRGGGGGFGRRPAPTTGGGGDGGVAGDTFTPGQDGSLAWNTTQPIADKPILLYVFDGHVFEGTGFDYSKKVELEFLKNNKELIAESRGFTCEKICRADHEFLRKVKGREPVNAFLAANLEKPEQRKVQILLLDSTGQLIATFANDPKQLKTGAAGLLKLLRDAKVENQKRLEAAAPKKA